MSSMSLCSADPHRPFFFPPPLMAHNNNNKKKKRMSGQELSAKKVKFFKHAFQDIHTAVISLDTQAVLALSKVTGLKPNFFFYFPTTVKAV